MINKNLFILILLLNSVSLFAQDMPSRDLNPTGDIQVATFDTENRLIRPDNVDEWILLGVSVGHGYPKEGEEDGFTLNNPGKLQVIQMEPGAYNFFKKINPMPMAL